MPVAVPVPAAVPSASLAQKAMGSLNARCEKAMAQAMTEDFNGEYLVGAVEEFSDKEFQTCEYRISVSKGRVYVVECPLPPHDEATGFFANDLVSAMNRGVSRQQALGPDPFYFAPGPTFKDYRNIFECIDKKKLGKTPDGMIGSRFLPSKPKKYDSPIVFKVSFRNESFAKLVREGVN